MGAAPSCGRPPTPVDKKMARPGSRFGGQAMAGELQPGDKKIARPGSRAARRLQFEKVGKALLKESAQSVGGNRFARRQGHCADRMRPPRVCARPTERRLRLVGAQSQAARRARRSWGRCDARRDGALRLHGAPRFSPPPKKKSEKGRQNERWPSAHLKGLRPNQPQRLPHPQKTHELSKKKGRESTREVLTPSPVGFFCAGVKKQGKVCDKG